MTQSIGPPSLAQGTRIAVGFSTSISRFIPACGELSKPSWAIVQLTVHPSLRGELLAAPIFVRACAGSSPLARGTPLNLCLGRLPIRFIPAYAGNSSRSKASIFVGAVHPRLRGELHQRRERADQAYGSSPLTRGTRA